MELGSAAEWFSSCITAIGVCYSVYKSRKAGDLKIEFKATISTNNNIVTRLLGVKRSLKIFITNDSPAKIDVIQTVFFYKTAWYGKRNKEITISIGANVFDEDGTDLNYEETKHASYSYSNWNAFPKDKMTIWAYPYILLKTGRFIISKKGFKFNVSEIGYSNRMVEQQKKLKSN